MGTTSERPGNDRRRTAWRLGGVVAAFLVALVVALPALANGDDHHATATASFDSSALLWGGVSVAGVFLLLILSRLVLVGGQVRAARQSEGSIGYFAAVRQFSRNARLFLAYSILAELGGGIWAVMFNLYLLRVGFPIAFVGTFWLVNMLCHGALALPAGLIADRYGRRRAFFIATCVRLVAQGTLLFTVDPTAMLVLAGVAGFGDSFHGVTGAPFMMENSEPHERTHLFSLNSSFLQVSGFMGSLSGGLLPLAWAALLGIPPVEPEAARWSLVTGLPLILLALTPLAFMREKPVDLVGSFKELVTLRNVVHLDIIARLTLLSVMVGTGFGLAARFFNIFFHEAHHAADSQIGTIFALGAIASAGSILLSPVLAQRWGKARGILISQGLSVPFLLLMALVPSLSLVTTLFLVRGALYSIGMPLRNQLSMEFITSKERGTAAGFTHTAFDLGGGIGAGIAGVVITSGGFVYTFTVAAVLMLMPAILYYVFFDALEARNRRHAGGLPSLATGTGR
ncbi:MAG: MFS transporter [Chloroflexi bacterium]|nr:MFS transporter [Chloroflexota bacterium]